MNIICQSKFKININGKQFENDDPIITGRQILKTANKAPSKAYALFLLLNDGDMEEIRLDETVDLRNDGVETFLAFKTDRIFRFDLNDQILSLSLIHI